MIVKNQVSEDMDCLYKIYIQSILSYNNMGCGCQYCYCGYHGEHGEQDQTEPETNNKK